MKLGKLTAYSDKLLKGKRMTALLVCLMLTGTELFFRLAEAALCSIFLYITGMEPVGLFTGESRIQQAITLICTVLRYLTTAPLIYAAAYWFTEFCAEAPKCRRLPFTQIIFSRKIYCRSLAALLMSKAVGFIFLIPAAFFGSTAFSLIASGIKNTGELRLLTAVHASVMTLLSGGLWIWAKLALLAVPYLLILFPQKSVFRIVIDSFRFMKGRRTIVMKIFALYISPMLLLVTIPFLLPKLFAALSLCISISLKEDEYLERNKADRNIGQADNSPKLSARTKRRFAPPADKAQAAGYGDNAQGRARPQH